MFVVDKLFFSICVTISRDALCLNIGKRVNFDVFNLKMWGLLMENTCYNNMSILFLVLNRISSTCGLLLHCVMIM